MGFDKGFFGRLLGRRRGVLPAAEAAAAAATATTALAPAAAAAPAGAPASPIMPVAVPNEIPSFSPQDKERARARAASIIARHQRLSRIAGSSYTETKQSRFRIGMNAINALSRDLDPNPAGKGVDRP